MFTITGLRNGRRVSVTWHGPGDMEGDAAAIAAARAAVERGELLDLRPMTGWQPACDLDDPWLAYGTIWQKAGITDPDPDGTYPEPPHSLRLPPGAIS